MPVIYDSILEHHNELRSLMREMTSIKLDPDVRNKAFKDFADELKEDGEVIFTLAEDSDSYAKGRTFFICTSIYAR